MLKYFLLFLIISNSALSQRLNLDERRKKIIGIIDEELSEVSRLSRQQENKNPDTLLRLSELNLEKARLYREAENEQFLNISPEDRRSLKKEKFFTTSSRYFNEANQSALIVVKNFAKYRGISEVYYILAYNYKELGDHEQAQKFFKLAAGGGQSDIKISLKAKLNLADYYYHERKFKEAIPLFEASINTLNDKWWTKDSVNLAWSYYRVGNYDKAINLMLVVHRRSGDNKYIDMKSTVERDIGIFYIDAGRMKD